ncbi:MAG: class I SAM-dependent methyltransferase [Bacteroidetes bacterium]|nr:MAG: class I SAM-dependent methyltransferase [Bacteroidota bacterium]
MFQFYNRYFLPHITHKICSLSPAAKQRQKVVPQASGRVLEIGVGSGLNLPFYDPDKVERLFALDPSAEMWAIAQKQLETPPFEVEYLQNGAEQIPLDTHTVDTVVITYTMCSIPDVQAALAEMRRVLKPGGALLFCEHGLAPDRAVRRWQYLLNPAWKRLGGGCHLTRDIPALIGAGAFSIEQLETMYLPGFKPAGFNYWGVARPAR